MRQPTYADTLVPNAFFVYRGVLTPSGADTYGKGVVNETFDRCTPQFGFSQGRKWINRDHLMGRFGLPGVTYAYKGKPKPIHPLTPTLTEMVDVVSRWLDHRFNCVVVNYYLNGGASLYPHSDAQYIPQLGPEPVIAAVSFGARRPLVLKPMAKGDPTRQALSVELGHGDLFVMHGESQAHWKHGLPEVPGLTQARVSLTFRWHNP